jgi:hypothetical protein
MRWALSPEPPSRIGRIDWHSRTEGTRGENTVEVYRCGHCRHWLTFAYCLAISNILYPSKIPVRSLHHGALSYRCSERLSFLSGADFRIICG